MKPDPDAIPDTTAPSASPADPLSFLEGYWDALEAGLRCGPEEWAEAYPVARENLAELRLLKDLHEAVETVRQDSQHEGMPTPAYPAANRDEAARPLLPPGTLLDRYQIEACLGRGGMGEVYRAEHTVMGNKVAVKVVAAHLAASEAAIARFHQEVRNLAALRPHPNVAAAFDAGEYEGRPYLVMEYVPGTDLKQYVERQGPLPVAEACAFVRQTALGLEYLHRHGIVHRDLKPSNLVLTPERQVKLLDLGLARFTGRPGSGGDTSLTPAGAVLGTLDYLAPEQAEDASAADARSDLYSLGCTFYHLLTGRPPFFAHKSATAKLAARARDPAPALAQIRSDVPPAVTHLVEKLLAKRPEVRYQSAGAFLEALEAGGAGNKPGHMALPRWGWRSWLAAGIAFVALAGLLINFATRKGTGTASKSDSQDMARDGMPDRPVVDGDFQLWVGEENRPTEPAHLTRRGVVAILEEPLLQNRGFILEGKFKQPTFWYIVWFDTNGREPGVEASAGAQAALQYPPLKEGKDQIQKVEEMDPPGTHALVVVAGSVAPDQAEKLLKTQLAGIGKPPDLSHRGAGERITTTELPAHYLQRIDNQLPPGLVRVYALFFTTTK